MLTFDKICKNKTLNDGEKKKIFFKIHPFRKYKRQNVRDFQQLYEKFKPTVIGCFHSLMNY